MCREPVNLVGLLGMIVYIIYTHTHTCQIEF